MCREQGNTGGKAQPVLLPGEARKACMQKCLPFPSPATAQFTVMLPCSPFALHPTPRGSCSSLLLTLATPVAVQAPHPNPSHQSSAMARSSCFSLLLLLLWAPCPVSPRSFPTWILMQDTPISPPVHQRTGPCLLIPTHILWVVLSLILHCFFAQTQ